MTMKIDSSKNLLPPSLGRDGKTRSPGVKSGDKAPPAAAGGTSVNVGTSLHGMGNSTANIPVNISKLAEIKQAISEGRIQLNSGAVADGLIKSVVDLIASQQA